MAGALSNNLNEYVLCEATAEKEESVARYLSQLDTADRQEPTEALAAKVTRLTEKLTKLKEEMASLPFTRSRCLLRLTKKSH